MSYRVTSKGVMIEVDTDRELEKVLGILKIMPSNSPPATPPASPSSDDDKDEADDEDDDEDDEGGSKDVKEFDEAHKIVGNLATLMQVIPENQKAVLKMLAAVYPKGCYDTRLREALKLADGHALGGLFTGITKNASKLGLPQMAIRHRSKTPGTNWAYFLSTEIGPFLAEHEELFDLERAV